MIPLMKVLLGVFERGLIFSLVSSALFFAARIIRFNDLSVEGSFGLGGALTALLIAKGCLPWATLPLTLVAGACVGMCTGLLHVRLGIGNLICGIIVATALFSVSLKVGGSNLALMQLPTIFKTTALPASALLLMIVALCTLALYLFLKTDIGFVLRAVGSNPQMVTSLGKWRAAYKVGGLMLVNAVAALAGGLFVQYVGYFSIWANVGVMIVGIAGLMLSEAMSRGFGVQIIAGAMAYQCIIAATFELNIDQDWNKLVTAVLIVALIAMRSVHTQQEDW